MVMPSKNGPVILSTEVLQQQMKNHWPCPNGLLTSRTVFKLNEHGDVVESFVYAYDNSLVGREKFERQYDARGNWVLEDRSKWNSLTSCFEPVEITYRTITYYGDN
ncbi:MAG TPA: hypothetical protein VGC64_08895, partial [Pyrinomonadaceae bacterium]